MSKSRIWRELKTAGNPEGFTWGTPKATLLQSLDNIRAAARRQEWEELREDLDLGNLFEVPKITIKYTAYVTLSGKARTVRGQVRVGLNGDIDDSIQDQLDQILDGYGQKIADDYELEYEVVRAPVGDIDINEIELDAGVYIHHDDNIDYKQQSKDCALYAVWNSLQKAVDRQWIKAVGLPDIMAVIDRKYVKGSNSLTINEIKKLCEHFKINATATDANGKLVLDYLCPNYHHNGYAYGYLYFVAHMGHCYTVTNARKVSNRHRQRWQVEGKDKGTSSICDNLNVAVDVALREEAGYKNPTRIYVQAEKFEMSNVFDIMQNRRVLFSINSTGENVKTLKFRGTTIFACPNLGECREICEVEKIDFKGQDIGSISVTMFNKYNDKTIHSELSIEGQKIFHHRTVRPCNMGSSGGDAAFDICKAYTHCLRKIEKYPVYTVFDEPEPYDGELKLGYYYILTDNSFPFSGNGWYGSNLVSYAIEQKIQLWITYQYIPQYSVDNPFRAFIERAVKHHPRNAKKLINYFVGTLNIAPKILETMIVTNSLKEYVYYINENEGSTFSKEGELFRVKYNSPPKISVGSNKPLYSFIIDQGKVEVHKLSKMVGGELVGVKTDCVYVRGNYTIPPLGKEIGEYRVEQCLIASIGEPQESNALFDYTPPRDWGDYPTNNGKCIDGPAGTGKSWLINNMESDAQRLAFTNAAAHNVKGRTLHSALRMKVDQTDAKVDGEDIIVDEYSMIPESIYAILLKKRQTYPMSHITLAGDSRQIQFIPREGLNPNKPFPRVTDTTTFKELCGYNIEVLTECKRANDVYFKACLSGDYKSISRPSNEKVMCSVNIVRTNMKRAILNQKFNAKYSQVATIIKTIQNYDYGRGVVGDLAICEGSRWISRSRNKSLRFVKNQFFDIVDGKLKSVTSDLSLSLDELKHFDLRWAMTVNKCQGQTIRRKFAIHEFDMMDKHSQYTAVSRGTTPGQFQIYN